MPNVAYNWPGATLFWISTMNLNWYIVVFVTLAAKIRHCIYHKYWDRYIPEETVHTQIRSSLIMVYTV